MNPYYGELDPRLGLIITLLGLLALMVYIFLDRTGH
jgi:hypothetical protein